MFRFYVIFFLLWGIIPQSIIAQKEAIVDSLEKLLQRVDTPLEKARIYDELATRHFFTDINKALIYAEKGLILVPKNEIEALADLHNIVGAVLNEFGDQNKTQIGILHLDTALTLYTRIDNKKGMLKIYSNQGVFYRNLFKYDLALNAYQKGKKLAEKLKDTLGIAKSLSGIGGLYLVQQQVDKGLEYVKKAYELESVVQVRNDKKALAIYTSNIGQIYYSMESYDSSLHYFNSSLLYLNENEYLSIAGQIYERIGSVYIALNKLDSAILYVNKVIELGEKLKSRKLKLTGLTTLAQIYFQAGNFKQSIVQAEDNLALAEKNGNYSQQHTNLELLIQNYTVLEVYKSAYTYQLQLIEVQKLLLDEKKQERIDQLEVKYETYKKEQENKLLVTERDAQKYKAERNEQYIYAAFLILLIVILIAYALYQRAKIVAREQSKELKHQLLRNQMNPHFIFNALIAIQSFVYKNNPEETDKYLSAFSKLMRGILENATKEYISLEKELKWLKYYLKLQALRFDDKFTYEIIIDPEIDVYSTLIPPMLTQPFIENALEHGLKNIDYPGEIYLTFEEEGEYLKVSIRDNGVGIKAENIPQKEGKHVSLATKITKERLQFLNKKTSSKIYFEIKSIEPVGTLVFFRIPLKYT